MRTRNLLSGPSAQSQGLGQALRVTHCEGSLGPPPDSPARGQERMLSRRTEIGGLTLRTRRRAEKGEVGCTGQGRGWDEAERDEGEEECSSDMRKRLIWRRGHQGTVREPGSDTWSKHSGNTGTETRGSKKACERHRFRQGCMFTEAAVCWALEGSGHSFSQSDRSPDLSGTAGCCGASQVAQFSSVTQSCPTLCDPMNRSTPGLPVHHRLSEFTQTHVH